MFGVLFSSNLYFSENITIVMFPMADYFISINASISRMVQLCYILAKEFNLTKWNRDWFEPSNGSTKGRAVG